ncbi:MAG: protein phosphatase 2C domain-containing protein, partial [Cellulosimicrobium funkei]
MSDSPAPVPAPPVPGGTVAEPSGVLACPACGEPSPEGARFCEACGTPLAPLPTATDLAAGTGAAADLATDAATDPAAAGTGDGGPGPDAGTDTGTAVPSGEASAETDGTESGARPCVRCGGRVAEDGYCTECGEPAASERDHWAERPASWVAGVCDRGVRHSRNEDAMALAASPSATAERAFAALVVCDGVSSAPDSDVASLAAARAARDVLAARGPDGPGPRGGPAASPPRARAPPPP